MHNRTPVTSSVVHPFSLSFWLLLPQTKQDPCDKVRNQRGLCASVDKQQPRAAAHTRDSSYDELPASNTRAIHSSDATGHDVQSGVCANTPLICAHAPTLLNISMIIMLVVKSSSCHAFTLAAVASNITNTSSIDSASSLALVL